MKYKFVYFTKNTGKIFVHFARISVTAKPNCCFYIFPSLNFLGVVP